jgi:hypothetical protein
VALIGQDDQPRGAAVALDGLEQPLRLHRERAGVGVQLTVDEQDGRGDPVGVAERRHPVVDRGHLPEAAALGLEAERGQRPVVGAAAGDSGREQVCVREQVGGHEGAVAVPADGDPARVGDALLVERADVSRGGGADLLDEGVVHGVRVADDRHGGAGQHRVAAQHEPGRVGTV